MIRFASLLAGRRRSLLCTLVALLLAFSSAAQAQRLLTLMPGAGQAASAARLGPSIGPVPTAARVDLELLRSAPLRLEVPTPDGSVLSAERSVFEDRGGGDLMWSGGQPEAGYDTVVLTVEGGRLVGRFGAAGGGVYQIHAERDGRGGMAPIVGPDGSEPWCAVETDADGGHDVHAHGLADVYAADPPEPVSNPQNHERLDILVLYTATAAENWADRGGALASIRHAGDYLKMVFRNNDLPVEPHIVHVAQASAALDRVGRDLGRHEWQPFGESELLSLHMGDRDGVLPRLRLEHRADMVYLFHGESRHLHGGVCGRYRLLEKNDEARWVVPSGWSSNDPTCGDYAAVFVHELGHGLGAHHEPANLVGLLGLGRDPWLRLFAPYALGHVNYDVMPGLGTAMSYQGQIEPFFSTTRIKPYGGATIGVADQQDNARTLRETVPMIAQVSDYLRSIEGLPAQPSNLRGRLEGAFASLSWQDNAPDADGYYVDHYVSWGEDSLHDIVRVEGRTEAVLPLKITVPGARHQFAVLAGKKGDVYSLASNRIALIFPGDPIEAPSDVSVAVDPQLGAVEVRWADNSDNETGFDVQLLRAGDPIRRQRLPAGSTKTSFYASNVLPRQRAEYEVRVFAFSSSGQSGSSGTVAFRWDHPLAVGPVANLSATAIEPTKVRVTWTVDPEVGGYRVDAELPGWQASRNWFPPLDGAVDTGWIDFEGLARGGRYTFEVTPSRPRGLPSRVYLALGERDAGPRAPSDPSLTDDGELRLSWTDNSTDETGFEIQVGVVEPGSGGFGHRQSWWRAATAPLDTESAFVSTPVNLGDELRVRVFAYNERGFSFGSPRVPERPAGPAGSCQADAETLCLQNSRFQVKVGWWNADGESGVGQVVEDRTDDSGMFEFFGPENWEILIKVLDGCRPSGRMWVLGAATTDLGYRIVVTDTVTGESRSYENEPGQRAPAIVDTDAFSRSCGGGEGP
ncbi:MAG: hypothetical protein OXI49_06625 [Acidobacteriota bacterium]|nr:hypothetical protein [Acidobacteriota bacterium]